MKISSRYHRLFYLLWIGGVLLILGGLIFSFAWVITGGRLFDAPEPGLVQLTHYKAFSEYPAWSPDGLSVLFQSTFEDPGDSINKLYSIGLNDRLVRRIETNQIEPYQATWSPNRYYIAFSNWKSVCLVRIDGESLPSCVVIQDAQWLSWSPDGKEIIFDTGGTIYRLIVTHSELISQPEPIQHGTAAIWSPDGACIAYTIGDVVWIMQADGSNPVQLPGIGSRTYPFGWSPDGQYLLVNKYPSIGASQFYAIRLSDGKKIRLTNNHEYHTAPRLSPDGKRIAFHSLRDNKADGFSAYNIYVMDVPDLPSPKTPVDLGDCMPPFTRAKTTSGPAVSSISGGKSTPGKLERLFGSMKEIDIILSVDFFIPNLLEPFRRMIY